MSQPNLAELFARARELSLEDRRALLEELADTRPEVVAELQQMLDQHGVEQQRPVIDALAGELERLRRWAPAPGRFVPQDEIGRGAMGSVRAVWDEALHRQVAPPTIHFSTPDEECPVDCVPNRARPLEARVALNNAYAFGGNNASTVFARHGG